MSCKVYARRVDEPSNRTVEELVHVVEGDYSPRVAFSVFIADEEPPAGTYTVEAGGGRLTLTYDPTSS